MLCRRATCVQQAIASTAANDVPVTPQQLQSFEEVLWEKKGKRGAASCQAGCPSGWHGRSRGQPFQDIQAAAPDALSEGGVQRRCCQRQPGSLRCAASAAGQQQRGGAGSLPGQDQGPAPRRQPRPRHDRRGCQAQRSLHPAPQRCACLQSPPPAPWPARWACARRPGNQPIQAMHTLLPACPPSRPGLQLRII